MGRGRGRGRDEGKGWRDSDGAIESLVLPGCEQEEGTLGQQRVNAPENVGVFHCEGDKSVARSTYLFRKPQTESLGFPE